MKLSQKGLNLIKKYEGFRALAYDDLQPNITIVSESQIKGTLTIGYGSTHNVKVGQMISKEDAEKLLAEQVVSYANAVANAVKVSLTQNMFDALTSFTYNLGVGNLRKSILLKKLNSGDYVGAGAEFLVWNKANGKVLQGLVRRRKEEAELFLNDVELLTNQNKQSSSSIPVKGEIIVDGVKNYTYIYERTSDKSKILDKAVKNARYSIAGSVTGWWEVIYNGKRAYIKAKYARRIK